MSWVIDWLLNQSATQVVKSLAGHDWSLIVTIRTLLRSNSHAVYEFLLQTTLHLFGSGTMDAYPRGQTRFGNADGRNDQLHRQYFLLALREYIGIFICMS